MIGKYAFVEIDCRRGKIMEGSSGIVSVGRPTPARVLPMIGHLLFNIFNLAACSFLLNMRSKWISTLA